MSPATAGSPLNALPVDRMAVGRAVAGSTPVDAAVISGYDHFVIDSDRSRRVCKKLVFAACRSRQRLKIHTVQAFSRRIFEVDDGVGGECDQFAVRRRSDAADAVDASGIPCFQMIFPVAGSTLRRDARR